MLNNLFHSNKLPCGLFSSSFVWHWWWPYCLWLGTLFQITLERPLLFDKLLYLWFHFFGLLLVRDFAWFFKWPQGFERWNSLFFVHYPTKFGRQYVSWCLNSFVLIENKTWLGFIFVKSPGKRSHYDFNGLRHTGVSNLPLSECFIAKFFLKYYIHIMYH